MQTQIHDTQKRSPLFETAPYKESDFWATVTDAELAFWSNYKIQGLGKFYTEFKTE